MLTFAFEPEPVLWDLQKSPLSGSGLSLKGHEDAILSATWHSGSETVVTSASDSSIGLWVTAPDDDSGALKVVNSKRFLSGSPIRQLEIDAQSRWLAAVHESPDTAGVSLYAWPETVFFSESGVCTSSRFDLLGSCRCPRDRVCRRCPGSGHARRCGRGRQRLRSIASGNSPNSSSVGAATLTKASIECLRVARRPAGDVIATGASDGTVHCWRPFGGSPTTLSLRVSSQAVSSIDLTADGRWLAAGSWNGSVWLWDTSSAKKSAIRLPTNASVHVVRIDPQSRWLIAGCENGLVYRWDLTLAKLLALVEPTLTAGETTAPEKVIEAVPLS